MENSYEQVNWRSGLLMKYMSHFMLCKVHLERGLLE